MVMEKTWMDGKKGKAKRNPPALQENNRKFSDLDPLQQCLIIIIFVILVSFCLLRKLAPFENSQVSLGTKTLILLPPTF